MVMAHEEVPCEDTIQSVLRGISGGFRSDLSSKILNYPDEAGLNYEDVTFSSEDDVNLKGWFIPRHGSKKIIIANHPRWFNRAGVKGYPPDEALVKGNHWAVNFIPDYKILHDAGYNVLAYDYRNHGESGVTGVYTSGIFESRDVVASINYIRSRPDTSDMKVGLFSRCNGANSTLHAIRLYPAAFEDIRVIVTVQPMSAGVFMEKILESLDIPLERMEDLDEMVYKTTQFHISDLTPVPSAAYVHIPTFMCQVYDDYCVRPRDVQSMYDNIPTDEKKLHWIEGTNKRWKAYTWFQESPEKILDWINKYM